jgi:hypothetical protein
MIHKLQVTIMILLIPALGLYWYAERNDIPLSDFLIVSTPVVRIDDIPIQVEVADTPEKREIGLSGRDRVGLQGLLFIFDESDYHKIWMKGMKFPIDVIWISEDLEVVGVTENMLPNSYPKTVFEPPKPIKYLIETEANFADTFDIAAGDEVELPKGY